MSASSPTLLLLLLLLLLHGGGGGGGGHPGDASLDADGHSIIMGGTSPFSCNTPSYHSSSYLPKLEANFMRDFACCGANLASLHDLVKHYETVHGHSFPAALSHSRASASHAPNHRTDHSAGGVALMGPPEPLSLPMNRAAYGNGPISLPVFSPPTPSHAAVGSSRETWRGRNRGFSKTSLPPVPDFDVVDDMEMDDAIPLDAVDDRGTSLGLDLVTGQARSLASASASASASSAIFSEPRGPGRPALPPLDLVGTDFGQGASVYPGLHAARPTTPLASAQLMRPLQNNPTVSSVNTPTLTTQKSSSSQRQQQQQGNPFTALSAAGDDSFGQTSNGMPTPVSGVPHFGIGNAIGSGASGMCIDHPAKSLFGHDGDAGRCLGQRPPERPSSQRSRQRRSAKANRQDGETGSSKRSKAQASAANGDEECRPFRCPVVGCEKSYKNQNGLKYHRTVSAPCRGFYPSNPRGPAVSSPPNPKRAV